MRAHEHKWEVKGERAECAICSFSVPKTLICCTHCGQPNVTTVRVYLGGLGPFCSNECAHAAKGSK